MSTISTTPGQVPVGLYADDTLMTTYVPVDGTSNTPVRVTRVVVPVLAGDVLDITAGIRLTNDLGYTVGVGARLRWYDYDDGVPWPHAQPWTEIPYLQGDNVSPLPHRHHIPMTLNVAYKAPDTWPAPITEGDYIGPHRMVINLMVDGHWGNYVAGDRLSIDDYKQQIIVRRWSIPTPPAA